MTEADRSAEKDHTEMASQQELWDAIVRVRDLLVDGVAAGRSSVPIALVHDALEGSR